MKKRFSLLTLIVTVLVACLITFQITYISAFRAWRGDSDSSIFSAMSRLEAIDYAYRNYFYGEIDEKTLENGLIAGYIYGAGDKHGEYMTAEEYAEFNDDTNGANVGIGVIVVYDEELGGLDIVNVIPGGPAEKAGILIGDVITVVSGEKVVDIGYYTALEKMKGEPGSIAEFTVMRGDEKLDLSVERALVTQVNVSGRMNSDLKTGIIRIEEFDTTTPKQFKDEVEKLKNEGAERFVFDVRGNPGGDLDSIVAILDYLLPEGPIIRIEDKEGGETVRESDAACLDMPMAVLVNSNTASAAELFAAALKDYEVAAVVGTTTYGKGSMQTIIPLTDGSALRITFKMYKPPFSEGYDGVGVEPNIAVEMAEDVADISLYKLTDEQDTQLIRAIEYLNTGK